MTLTYEADASGNVTFCDMTGSGPGTGAVRVSIAGNVEAGVADCALRRALEAQRGAAGAEELATPVQPVPCAAPSSPDP